MFTHFVSVIISIFINIVCLCVCLLLHSVVVASKVPSTRLRMSEGGEYIAVGSADGSVHVFFTDTFKKVSENQKRERQID